MDGNESKEHRKSRKLKKKSLGYFQFKKMQKRKKSCETFLFRSIVGVGMSPVKH